MNEPGKISEIISEMYAINGVIIQTDDDGEIYKIGSGSNATDRKRNLRTVFISKRPPIRCKRKIRETK